jgi:hypothetical protein
MDDDLQTKTKEELIAEVVKLRAGIREHRDASGHDLCHWVPELWGLLPDGPKHLPVVPPWPEFMQQCAIYRASLDKRTSEVQSTIDPEKREA